MPDLLTCADVSERDLIARYVGGSISDAEEEALETHTLGCESCWGDLQRAIEIRAALSGGHRTERQVTGIVPSEPGTVASQRPKTWVAALAAAATLLLAAGVWWQSNRDHDTETVLRGPADTLTPTFSWAPDGALHVSWTAHASAALYRVHIVHPDAEPVMQQATAPTMTFSAETMGRLSNAQIQIEAENSVGEVIARSRLVQLRPR